MATIAPNLSEAQGTVALDDVMWLKAVNLIAALAHHKIQDPAAQGHISRATALAMQRSQITYQGEGVWQVAGGTKPYQVDAHMCECDDFQYKKAPQGLCKHRLSVMIVRKASKLQASDLDKTLEELLAEEEEQADPPPTQTPLAEPAEAVGEEEETEELVTHTGTVRVPRSQVEYLKGSKQPFIKYTGLLVLAHARGLQSLEAEWTLNEEELSLARAVATFADGTVFKECGDATRANAKGVGEHWRRMSLTRSKARCLRDALGINAVCVEEME